MQGIGYGFGPLHSAQLAVKLNGMAQGHQGLMLGTFKSIRQNFFKLG